jgi:hypothetical protein
MKQIGEIVEEEEEEPNQAVTPEIVVSKPSVSKACDCVFCKTDLFPKKPLGAEGNFHRLIFEFRQSI